MKIFGIILITIGIAFLIYVGYSYVQSRRALVSPLPQDSGVKVIFVTPSK